MLVSFARITHDLGGTKITPCPSKQCIVTDVDVDDDDVLHLATVPSDGTTSTNSGRRSSRSRNKLNGADPVKDYVDRRLRRVLQDSGIDHTIVNGITRLPMPHDAIDCDEFRKQGRAEFDKDLKDDEDDEDKDVAPSPVHQHHVFKTILNGIIYDRMKVTKENLDMGSGDIFRWRKVQVNKNHVQQKLS